MGVNILLADDIKTRLLQVDKHFFGHHFKTTNGDIGYHFELSNETDKFEEGEIVGFVANSDGKCGAVQKLDFQNCGNARVKGVVTRSHYFEACVPKDGEWICLFSFIIISTLFFWDLYFSLKYRKTS